MRKALTLSIVIPVYNEQDHLKACLESIAIQTIPPDEVLVIDNNSTDKSAQIAKKFSFVRLINEKQQGVDYARDKGFNTAKSDIIGRIDSDTRLEPEWVETVLQIFHDEPATSAITGPISYYDMPLIRIGKKIDNSARTIVKAVQSTDFLFGSNMAIRKKAWLDIRDRVCHLPNIHEDLDLAIHLDKAGHKIEYKVQMLAAASSRRLDDNPKNYRKYLKMNIETYRAHGIETVTPRMATSIGWLAYVTLKPLKYTYDDKKRRLSLSHTLNKRKPRVNPNNRDH
ncbi:glycosyltransferase family 2 protein [Candidatus Saccharibacteria bacterium]|nr:glycosyltransferase family 2 protein [Candidatus Saccharibacteria bacterium]